MNLKEDIENKFHSKVLNIDNLLIFCTENKCSDLYIKVGSQPYISRYGIIYKVPSFELTNTIWHDWSKFSITSENNAKYVRQKMLDFSHIVHMDHKDNNNNNFVEYRYRVSAGFSCGRNIAAFRMISKELPSFNNINFPKNIYKILKQTAVNRNKITIFSGVTGSGKTTTMAACINDFSKPEGPFNNSVIISLEDPIEYLYNPMENVNIIQKELGIDFKEFSLGVKQALREHPNFINVGETRDKETIKTLVEASRTGHAVYTSFHTNSVADCISRLHNYLINDNPESMYDLISNMNIIICQRLIPNDKGFILDTQYMIFTNEIIKHLNKMIEIGKNIPNEIDKLFMNEELIKYKLVKNWDSLSKNIIDNK